MFRRAAAPLSVLVALRTVMPATKYSLRFYYNYTLAETKDGYSGDELQALNVSMPSSVPNGQASVLIEYSITS